LRIFHTPILFGAPLPIFPLEFHREVKHQETRVTELLCGGGCMILTSTVRQILIEPCGWLYSWYCLLLCCQTVLTSDPMPHDHTVPH